jgi:hypothetical protein
MEASPIATNDPFPLLLSDHTEESEQPVIGKARDRAAISSRILKTSISVVTGAAIVFAIRLVGKSTCAVYECHGFPGRHIGAAGWRRWVDANRSINRRRSGFAADCKGGAEGRRKCCRL